MEDRVKNSNISTQQKYEELYTELLSRGEQLHMNNKKRIRIGIIILIILPAALEFIRWITGSDKVVFLIIWIIIMFAVSAYLISIEYLDSTIENVLRDVTDTEEEFDGLLSISDISRPDLHERIRSRIAERRAGRIAEADEITEEDKQQNLESWIYAAEEKGRSKGDADQRRPDREKIDAQTREIDEALKQLNELKEAEAAMEELRETAPADIIAAMKEAFDADMERQNPGVDMPESGGSEDTSVLPVREEDDQ